MMLRMVPVKILLHCTLIVLSVAATKKSVSLELKTTGCEHNCVIYDKEKCLSSVKVNGEEYSFQEDGFNIVVIDNYTGKVKRDYFRWFSRLSPSRWKTFRDFFLKINTSSTVIVVFQNMCTFFDKKWYRYLSDASNIKISPIGRDKYDTAILVGCKVECPRIIKGAIPYMYYGVTDGHSQEISFQLSSDDDDDLENNGKKKSAPIKDKGNIGSVLGGIIAVLFIICIAVILYISYKRQLDWKNYFVCLMKDEANEEDQVMFDGKTNTEKVKLPLTNASAPVEQEYAPIFEPKKYQSQSNEHIYEYINPENLTINRKDKLTAKKPREAENEYYSASDVVKPDGRNFGGSHGISSVCSVTAGRNPPALFDHRQSSNRNEFDSGSAYTQTAANLHPASSRNDETWYDSPTSFRKGNYRNSTHSHRI